MSTDDQKVGLIPVTLMVAGNIMGSGVFITGKFGFYRWNCDMGMASDYYWCSSTINGLRQNFIFG